MNRSKRCRHSLLRWALVSWLIVLTVPSGAARALEFALSADPNQLLFSFGRSPDRKEIFAYDVSANTSRRLHGSPDYAVDWPNLSPDGRFLLMRGTRRIPIPKADRGITRNTYVEEHAILVKDQTTGAIQILVEFSKQRKHSPIFLNDKSVIYAHSHFSEGVIYQSLNVVDLATGRARASRLTLDVGALYGFANIFSLTGDPSARSVCFLGRHPRFSRSGSLSETRDDFIVPGDRDSVLRTRTYCFSSEHIDNASQLRVLDLQSIFMSHFGEMDLGPFNKMSGIIPSILESHSISFWNGALAVLWNSRVYVQNPGITLKDVFIVDLNSSSVIREFGLSSYMMDLSAHHSGRQIAVSSRDFTSREDSIVLIDQENTRRTLIPERKIISSIR